MFMESSEEVTAVAVVSYSSNGSSGVECDYASAVASFAKRKRTKRLRTSSSSSSPPSPPPPPPPPNEEDYFSTSTTTEEEEDMAHCLILLAQGRTAAASPSPSPFLPPREEKFTSRKFAETTTTATGAKAGFYVYECKTCNKCFPSFQALGGHRASHKKPKLAVASAVASPTAVKADVDHDGLDISMNSSFAKSAATAPPPPAPPAPPNKLRVHECSICGSEFASGQALGGHMRRHRPVGAVPPAAAAAESPELLANYSSTKKEEEEENKKKCMMLSLDLNLPAPSEENAMAAAFAGFTVDQRPLALVGCHY